MRLFGNLPAVANDHAFMLSAIDTAIEAGARKVLVSGSADHGVLAYVIAAFDNAGVRPDITVIDQCGTPLAVCSAYAREHGHTIKTHACDALTYFGGPFDLIVAHNFLNFFSPDARVTLVRNWAALLVENGCMINLSAVKENVPERVLRFPPEKAEELAERMCDARRASAHSGLISEEEMRHLVHDYCARRNSWAIPDIESLTAPFLNNGFVFDTPPRVDQLASRPGRKRVGIIARRA
ncbi:class I SAM-dependent methyltransferase [Yoonia tamlensis]|nr:class I SAM-dependent methyltransferase [Yoonia tamlensis]